MSEPYTIDEYDSMDGKEFKRLRNQVADQAQRLTLLQAAADGLAKAGNHDLVCLVNEDGNDWTCTCGWDTAIATFRALRP